MRKRLAAMSTNGQEPSDRTKLATLLNLRSLEDLTDDGLWAVLANAAVRRQLQARTTLFSNGDPSRFYYLVECGELLVHRHVLPNLRPTARVLNDGDVFTYDCAGYHAAECVALTDSVVRCVDRQIFDERASTSHLLQRVLHAVHSAELEMILESLTSPSSHFSEPSDIKRSPPFPAVQKPAAAKQFTAAILRPDFGGRKTTRLK